MNGDSQQNVKIKFTELTEIFKLRLQIIYNAYKLSSILQKYLQIHKKYWHYLMLFDSYIGAICFAIFSKNS